MRVLSLGAGVQSSTLLLMSCRGELPKLDAAIFADTQWEPPRVYEHLTWLILQAQEAGIPVHVVTRGNLRADALRSGVGGRKNGGERWASMPLYTLDRGDQDRGQIRRQCTREYKLDPIRARLRKLLGLRKGERIPKDAQVEQWIGISADETGRVRLSRDWWITHAYPLIYWVKPAMLRRDCVAWLAQHYPGREVPKSACVGCPFHSNAEWRQVKQDPKAWADAVEFDRAIRKGEGMRGDCFVHQARVPLEEADLNEPDPRQGSLWSKECLGMCGV
jgi:hypothetical protein